MDYQALMRAWIGLFAVLSGPPLEAGVLPDETSGEAIQTPRIVINEIHYDPPDKTRPEEFIELHNPTTEAVDLSGWFFDDGIRFTIPAGTVAAPDAYVVISRNPGRLRAAFQVNSLGPWDGSLDNDGERIRLRDSNGLVVDEVAYDAGFPWPTAARGSGDSMELISAGLDNELAGSWRSSSYNTLGLETTYVAPGAEWRFRKGSSEPSNPSDAWRQIDFADQTWLTGAAPIGYGDDDDATVLADMRGSYSTVYFRKSFSIQPGVLPEKLLLRVYVDDGAIVWLNGVEVGRFFVGAGEKRFNHFGLNHEAAWVKAAIDNADRILVPGNNVLAVHALNGSLNSSDFSLDAELRAPAAGDEVGSPTPGAQNATATDASAAPPAVRQVNAVPDRPRSGADVVISARVTDPDGVDHVVLRYQVVAPGAYVSKLDPRFDDDGWIEAPMRDDAGAAEDTIAGDTTYTAVIPGTVQQHRRLVRYQILAIDANGASVQVPYLDDESPNFAYFVHDGAPAWTGSDRPGQTPAQTFDRETMNDSLPIYHLIAGAGDVQRSQYESAYKGVMFPGTLVYDGAVYDHIRFANRGEYSTYQSGKNKWQFRFNRTRDFRARDNYGQPYRRSWRILKLNGCASPWIPANRGMAGLDEAVPHRLYELAGVPSPRTHWIHFRVIDDSVEASPTSQYEGDLWGLYLAVEHPDGRFLDQRDLPDGNVYKIFGGNPERKNQGATQPSDGSDWVSFFAESDDPQTVDWWRRHLDLESYFGFRAINRAAGNVDLRADTNYYMYHRPDGRWSPVPWDLDMMFIPETHWSGVIRAETVLQHEGLAIEFRNRCRELLDLLFSDAADHGGQAAQLVEELSRIVNPDEQPLTFADVDQFLWNLHPQSRGGHRGAFYTNPASQSMRGGTYSRTLSSPDLEGFEKFIKDYLTDTDRVGRFQPGDGDPFGYGFNFLSREAADPAIPARPGIEYAGDPAFQSHDLRFAARDVEEVQGDAWFAALEWRVGRVLNPATPDFQPGIPWIYEIEPVWTSGELNDFRSESRIPASAILPGATYRARVRVKDRTGRWSHWSMPVQFVAAPPDISVYRRDLWITEIMYHPEDGESTEFVELTHIGSGILDLREVRFTAGIQFDFASAQVRWLEPGSSVLVVRDRAAFEARYGSGLPIAGEYRENTENNLSNAGERLTLSFGANTPIHDFEYNDRDPWPEASDGGGRSLVLMNPTRRPDPAQAENWRASAVVGGSPGRAGSNTIERWRATAFSPAQIEAGIAIGDLEDPDRDGRINLFEYALGSDPAVADPIRFMTTPGTVRDGASEFPTLTYSRRADAGDLRFWIEVSDDLRNWRTDDRTVLSVSNVDGDIDRVTARLGQAIGGSTAYYARLRLEIVRE